MEEARFVFAPVLVPTICSLFPPLKSLWLKGGDWADVWQVAGREL